MTEQGPDGSAGDADYGALGRDYAVYRHPSLRSPP